MRKNPRPSLEQFRDAYARFRSDIEAAVSLGIHRVEFATWRKQSHLPARSAINDKPTLPAREVARRLAAYEATQSDREAARQLKMDRLTFRQWRAQRDLPAKGRRVVELSAEEMARRTRIYFESRTEREAACEVGLSPRSFSRWRQLAHLPPKRLERFSTGKRAERLRYYARVRTDKELGARVGVTQQRITYWRKEMNLKPKTGPGSPLGPEEWERREKVILSSKSSNEAARRLGVGRSRVWECVRVLKLNPDWPTRRGR